MEQKTLKTISKHKNKVIRTSELGLTKGKTMLNELIWQPSMMRWLAWQMRSGMGTKTLAPLYPHRQPDEVQAKQTYSELKICIAGFKELLPAAQT